MKLISELRKQVLDYTKTFLRADDYHVEGQGLTRDEVRALLRGPAGSRVALAVADAAGAVRHLVLERRALPQPPVKQVHGKTIPAEVKTIKLCRGLCLRLVVSATACEGGVLGSTRRLSWALIAGPWW